MKYLFFKSLGHDYGAEIDKVKVGALWMGVGMYEDKDAKKILKNNKDLVSEIDVDQYDSLKKNNLSVAERVFRTQPQDPSRDPNAVYANKESSTDTSQSLDAEELLSVGEAKVENPLDGKD
jgi:hypothetical protein